MRTECLRQALLWLACALSFGVLGLSHADGLQRAQSSDGFSNPPPANHDAAAAYSQATQTTQQALTAETTASRLLKPGTRMHRDERFGVPTFLWAAKGQPYGAGKAGLRRSEEEAARFHLRRFVAVFDLEDADVNTAFVRSIHNTGKGPIIVKLKQAIDGIEVFRDEMNIAMDRDLDLVSMSGFLPGARGRAGRARLAGFALDPPQAIVAAIQDLSEQGLAASHIERTGSRGGYDLYQLSPTVPPSMNLRMIEPARVKRVFFHLPDRLEAGYYVELNIGPRNSTGSDHFGYVISAVNGSILFRNNYTVSDSYSYRVWADTAGLRAPLDGPQGNSPTPHPTGLPDGFQAPFIPPNLVTLQNGPISTNDPWLPPGATETVGNNVEAYADLAAPDGFTPNSADIHATITGANSFDRTYDTTLSPQAIQNQQMAAIAQLFYNVNFFHDWYYDSGFDEVSGNAQENNFGRGGLDHDSIKAEAQDFSGRNNANMSTPPDGSRPRMQMFVFDGNGERGVIVNSPMAIAGRFNVGTATFGPQAFDFPGNVVLVNDGSVQPTFACNPLTNAGAVLGNIALVDRGTCSFAQKAQNVLVAGATGMVVVNNAAGVLNMAPTAPFNDNIPSLMISQADGGTIKGQLGAGVNVTMHRPQALDRDGTIDNQIVAHEWGHYISNRLISNSSGLTTNMARGLGEGWADFHAMLLTVKEGDAVVASNATFNGVYALAGYTLGGLNPDGAPNQGWYFGIRRVPYSTDFAKNALTLKHISNGVTLPAGVPTAFGLDGSSNAEVHNTGEIWATMLWECYAALLRDTLGGSPRLTFNQARDRMKNYLVAAYKLTPPDPTLLEARDALLSAATADPADVQLFLQAFARRGAGFGAVAPDRFSATNSPGLVESFTLGNGLEFTSAALVDDVNSCDKDGVLDNLETGRLIVTLTNNGSGALNATTATITSTNANISFPAGNLIVFPASQPFKTTAGAVNVKLAGANGIQQADFRIDFTDPAITPSVVFTANAGFRVNTDVVPNSSASDDVESPVGVWTAAINPGLFQGSPWVRAEATPLDHRWNGPDAIFISDQYLISPALNVGAAPFSFSFSHRFSFLFSGSTFFTGGVIEISADGGTTWTDIGASASPGYNHTIATGFGVPLEGRPAFSGISTAYPAFASVNVNLGTTFQNQSVKIRFRVAGGGAKPGWDIDNIAFVGITNTPFPSLVADRGICLAANTSTNLVSSLNPSVFGQAVTFTATVTGGTRTQTGNINFKDGSATIGTVALNGSGVASFTTTALAAGSHSITAQYAGDVNSSPSTSTILSQTVNAASTSASLTSSLNLSVFGQAVTFSATVTGGTGTPTGNVSFKDGVTTIGTVVLNSSGVASLATSTLAAGSHSITAQYAGDANFNGTTSAALSQTVNAANTSTSLTSSLSPTVFGQAVTFAATVTGGTGTPTGNVSFKDGVTTIGTVALNGLGVASLATSALAAGSHSITAQYVGDANFNGNTSAVLSQTVNAAITSTSLTSSLSPSVFGQAVTFAATVTGGTGTPTGNVSFKDGVTTIGTVALSGSGAASFSIAALARIVFAQPKAISASGSASLATSTLAPGSHSITAQYAGDANFNGSTSAVLSQTVNAAGTSTTLTSSLNPSVFGQTVTLTAAVAGGTGTPTGNVNFKDSSTTIGTVALDGTGSASFATSALAQSSHSITAQYAGDANFTGSVATALTQTVNPVPIPDFTVSAAPSTLTLTAGQSGSVTFTVTPINGSTQTVTLSCGSLPANATCTFAPASVILDGVHAATATATIQTGANVAASASLWRPSPPVPGSPLMQLAGYWSFSLFSLGFLGLRRPRRAAVTWMLLFGLAFALAACGDRSSIWNPAQGGTPPGTYSVSITATAGATSHAATISVIIQ